MHSFVGPDNYKLYHDLHDPDDCGVYCVSRGDIALPRTSSDDPVSRVVSTSGPGGPVGPCDEEGDVYEGDVALPRTGDAIVVSSE